MYFENHKRKKTIDFKENVEIAIFVLTFSKSTFNIKILQRVSFLALIFTND